MKKFLSLTLGFCILIFSAIAQHHPRRPPRPPLPPRPHIHRAPTHHRGHAPVVRVRNTRGRHYGYSRGRHYGHTRRYYYKNGNRHHPRAHRRGHVRRF